MNFLEKIKNSEQKKIIENSVIFLMLFIIIIIVMNTLFVSEDKNMAISSQANLQIELESNTYNDLEEKLQEILSLINGTGNVDVMISYLNGIEQIPMYDEKISTTVTEESDNEGGKRKTEQTNNEHNIIFEEKNSTKSAVIKQTVMPEVIGVVVVADGATDLKVKENIIKAVEATVNVPSHRIQVFARSKG